MSTNDHTKPAQQYEIRVRGHLGPLWATWFNGMSLTSEDDGTTVIRGTVVDQAALHGLLQKLRDLGITLLSLTSDTAIEQADDSSTQNQHQHQHHSAGATS